METILSTVEKVNDCHCDSLASTQFNKYKRTFGIMTPIPVLLSFFPTSSLWAINSIQFFMHQFVICSCSCILKDIFCCLEPNQRPLLQDMKHD